MTDPLYEIEIQSGDSDLDRVGVLVVCYSERADLWNPGRRCCIRACQTVTTDGYKFFIRATGKGQRFYMCDRHRKNRYIRNATISRWAASQGIEVELK